MNRTLLIVDRRSLVGECLKVFLKQHFTDMQVVSLTSVRQATSLSFSPVGCILTSDADALAALARAFPGAALMVIQDDREARAPRPPGDAPYLPLDLPAEAFLHAVRLAMRGQAAPRPPCSREPEPEADSPDDDLEDAPTGLLSEREREVLAALRRGLSNKVIAGELQLSENTVKIHVRNVMRKLGATNRTMAALHGAISNGGAALLT
jgi:DNA-binding NarL/FixJ family response regulator